MPLRVVLCVLLLSAGCTARHRACAPPAAARASGHVPVNLGGDPQTPVEAELIRSMAERPGTTALAPTGRPTNALALSGGGMYGAYTVGLLCGWTATGTRPPFDVVTGVSTGGLIATYAFLGAPYDSMLVARYTSLSDRDIYRRRPAPAVLWSDSVASSAPLKRLIDAEVTDEIMAAVAAAHQAGRRLYVGTTDLDARRLVIWDLGAIAASGRPDAKDLYRNILLASASVPGFFPPVGFDVEINGRRYTELHADGGATTGLFLTASMLHIDPAAVRAGHRPAAGSHAYAVVAGKLYADPACTDRRTVRIGESSLRSLLYSQTRGELFRIYTFCQLGGVGFHLASIPEDFAVGADAMSFDPGEMRRLYDAGYGAATGGRAWRDTPPGGEPQEQTRPRTGTEFYAPGAR